MSAPRLGPQRAALATLLGAIAATGLLLTGGLTVSHRHQQQVLARQGQARAEVESTAASRRGALFVPRVAVSGTAVEVDDSVWNETTPLRVAVRPQVVTMPVLDQSSVDSVSIAALVDGGDIVWRVSWRDPTPDRNVDSGRFCDALALQLPITENASFMMGAKDQSVQILHWKALWQLDVDEHFQDVQDLHPNYWTDLYWFAEGAFPYPVPEAFQNEASLAWFVAYQAGNPMADFHRRQPVEELSSQGFGTLTHQEDAVTRARGVWKDGEWTVLFRRPLRTDDPWDYQFSHGDHGEIAVAVWEGGAGNVGGRKHHSDWVAFQVQQ